jgi:hypothetical protein
MKSLVREKYGNPLDKEVITYRVEQPDDTANLALLFLEKWGLVAAMPDGEDSAGRSKLRLPTTQELVGRAFDIAQEAMRVTRQRGHMVDLPDLAAVNEK